MGNQRTVRIMAVGDIMLGRMVSDRILHESPEWLFADVSSLLQKADIVFGNLEAPISRAPDAFTAEEKIVLKAPMIAAEALAISNFKVLNLANNHILDCGPEGLKDTMNSLFRHQISHVGAGFNLDEARKPLVLEPNGIRISFLSYCSSFNATVNKAGTPPLNIPEIKKDIHKQRSNSDIIIVSLHHGVEYSNYPLPAFMKLGRAVIDAGADVILGHHPHVLQGIEDYRGKLIAYSLGNFVFDLADETIRQGAYRDCLLARRYGVRFEKDDNRVSESMILEFELGRDGLLNYKIHPIFIRPDFRPVPLDGIEGSKLLERMNDLSKNIGNDSLAMNQILGKLEADSVLDYLKNREITHYFRRLGKLRFNHLSLMAHVIKAKLRDISLFRR